MDFVNEEILHKKINNKDVYIWITDYDELQKISQNM